MRPLLAKLGTAFERVEQALIADTHQSWADIGITTRLDTDDRRAPVREVLRGRLTQHRREFNVAFPGGQMMRVSEH